MQWTEFLATVYFRLYVRLVRHVRTLAAADLFLARLGKPADDPLRVEVRQTLERTRTAVEVIRAAYNGLPQPYRPGVDPWQTSGLSARLRADFESRGITEPQRERPPLPLAE